MHYEALYPGRFLKGKALEAPKVIRIVSAAPTDLEGDDGVKAKCVLKYRDENGEGEIVWAKTNAALTAAVLDETDFEKWVGHLITIHFDATVRFGAETPGGIRVMGSPELKTKKRVELKRPRRKKVEVHVLVPTDKRGRVIEGTAATSPAATTPTSTDVPPTPSTTQPEAAAAAGDSW